MPPYRTIPSNEEPQLKPLSPQERILTWLGYYTPNNQSSIKVIISQELINQILRVGKSSQNSRSNLAES
ncbi:MAG: hypothetical protein O9332_01865 [Microcystis sp. LE19-10.1B]|uniref:hypothetical protein n=1 Tax=Microcystis sp. LE19-10.1B TaxID=3016428 RepID=UPI0022C339DC|nr:hypothetical protein [Microcystis sp. LE19-10.1B]MCZ8024242.1 hypothetical protein [Microcystis sp. LE19-10.1B]